MTSSLLARGARPASDGRSGAYRGEGGLLVRDLTKTYADVTALDEVGVRVPPGRVHGLVGPNGAGKSTLMAVLLGLVVADRGTLQLDGHPLSARRRRVPGGVAGTVEEARFYPYLTAEANLDALSRLDDDGGMSCLDALERVDLAHRATEKVAGFSMGMRARLGVAACLIRSPTLLVLDEPTSGLDPGAADELLELLRGLAEEGVCVVLSSHDLAAVHQVCDDITILVGGRVVMSGSTADLVGKAPPPSFLLHTSDDVASASLAADTRDIGIRSEANGLIVHGSQDALDHLVLALGARQIAVRRLEAHESALRLLFDHLTNSGGAR